MTKEGIMISNNHVQQNENFNLMRIKMSKRNMKIQAKAEIHLQVRKVSFSWIYMQDMGRNGKKFRCIL